MADLQNLRTALLSIPDRLFNGDLGAFAEAVGMTEAQTSVVMRSRSTSITRQTRADLYMDETGFQLLELNMGGPLGGMDLADPCKSMLGHPLIREFSREHNLGYTNSLREEVHSLFVECELEPGTRPVVALTDWPSYHARLATYLAQYSTRLQALGLDAHPCHVGQLEVRDDGVWLDNRRVDVILRTFVIENLLESPEAATLLDPILEAVADGRVKIFNPMDSEVFASKAALAMLSDERNRPLFTSDELISLDRILPWTRMTRPGPVTLENGVQVDLFEYALEHQHDLVLKPTLLHGGQGVLPGWADTTTAEVWREHLTTALDGPYVLQRRIRPVSEVFPDANGELVPWLIVWGAFTGVNGFAGILVRGIPQDADMPVVNIGAGAHAGPALYEMSDNGLTGR